MVPNCVRVSFASVIIITPALSVPVSGHKSDQKSDQKAARQLAKMDKALAAAVENGDPGEQPVIIRLAPGASLELADTLRSNGRKVKHVHRSINAVAVTVSASDLEVLSTLPSVESISADAVVTADQSYGFSSYTVRGTVGVPSSSPGGSRVGIAV